MKILIVDQFAQIGGAQRCLLDLLPAFQQRNWQLRVATAGEGLFPQTIRSLAIDVDVLPECLLSSIHKGMTETCRYLRWCSKASRLLAQLAAEFKPDLLYVNGPRLIPPITLLARRTRTPAVFHAHSRVTQTTALWALRAHLRFGWARVISCCRYVADSLRPYILPERLDIVYNGVPDRGIFPRPPSRVPVIGVVGRIEPEKGQLEFVRAVRLVHSKLPNSRFVVVGAPLLSKSDIYLRQTVEESTGLPITFTAWQDDITSVLHDLDILVVPSCSYDATPRIVMEAFSAGTPVVAFSSGGIPELIEDGRTGFLVNTRSPEALAHRILQVLHASENIRVEVATNARSKWDTDFRIEHYRERICEIVGNAAPL